MSHAPIYVICLRESSNRCQIPLSLQTQFASHELQIVEAVDTRTDRQALLQSKHVDQSAWKRLVQARLHMKRQHHQDLTNGAIGCYLSHIKTWKAFASSNKKFALVLEEDAVVTATEMFKNLVLPDENEWDILLLGCIDLKPTSHVHGWRRVTHFLETHAYIINRRSVKVLLSHALPIDRQIDWHLSDLAQKNTIKIYAFSPNIVTQNKSNGSNVQNMRVITSS